MGTSQKLKLEKIVDIFEAIKLVDELKLDFNLSYRLGRLQDRCKSIIRVYEGAQSKLQSEYAGRAIAMGEGETEEEKAAIKEELKKLNAEFMAEINNLLQIEEEITVPELKLKDFQGKEVPAKFFSLMGDVIKED